MRFRLMHVGRRYKEADRQKNKINNIFSAFLYGNWMRKRHMWAHIRFINDRDK